MFTSHHISSQNVLFTTGWRTLKTRILHETQVQEEQQPLWTSSRTITQNWNPQECTRSCPLWTEYLVTSKSTENRSSCVPSCRQYFLSHFWIQQKMTKIHSVVWYRGLSISVIIFQKCYDHASRHVERFEKTVRGLLQRPLDRLESDPNGPRRIVLILLIFLSI